MSKKSRKRKLEEEEQSMDCDQENFLSEELCEEMKTMWEIPQIFHFLHLTREVLNVPVFTMYEMERMLMIPRASRQLAHVMTCLLSSPATKMKVRKLPPMPYEFWTNILTHKLKSWFKIYEAKHRDAVKVLETIGVEPEFWSVFPDASLIDGKDFEELSFRQRVWLLKTVCDTIMHTRKTIQEEMAKKPWEDQYETVLGTDRCGARYIYFPQFIGSDLRIYRHCLDNKILSTVKPVKPKINTQLETGTSAENDSINKKFGKNGKNKPERHNGMSSDTRLSVAECKSEPSRNCSHNDDNTISRNRSRSSSVVSDRSMLSTETNFSTARSSDYDANASNINEGSPRKMFKGFSSDTSKTSDMSVLNKILSNLSSEISIERRRSKPLTSAVTEATELTENSNNNNSVLTCEDTKQCLEQNTHKDESNDRYVDALSGSSKTDDEKLNEIIGAETPVHTKTLSNGFEGDTDVLQISTSSKSDDEKLNETKVPANIKVSNVISINGWSDDPSETEIQLDNKRKKEIRSITDDEDSETCDSATSSKFHRMDKSIKDSDSEKELLRESRNKLLEYTVEDENDSCDDSYETKYNLRKSKNARTEEWTVEMKNFNIMLSELSVSKFQLVADSVAGLRDLIFQLSLKPDGLKNNTAVSACEVKLLERMRELLASVEKMEPTLKDTVRKAKGKLQKDWTNLKEGSVEDQDSSGEGGLGSNWWILGSQGCPLPTSGDATLQTLSHSALSPLGTQTEFSQPEEESIATAEQDSCEKQESGEPGQPEKTDEKSERSQTEEDGHSRDHEPTEETTEVQSKEESEQKTGRVLRARGVSSYRDPSFSDDEIEEDELEEWTDFAVIYAAPSTQTSASTSNASSKTRNTDSRSDTEDSDQDWILPSSRKRKNKRPSASRRLKSFQHKLKNINKADTSEESRSTPNATDSTDVKPVKDKSRNRESRTSKESQKRQSSSQQQASSESQKRQSSNQQQASNVEAAGGVKTKEDKENSKETVPSEETVCKIETVDSVHSELDIKDEGPIFDLALNPCENTYGTAPQQNYMIVNTEHQQQPINYYVVPSNPPVALQQPVMQPAAMIPGILPPIQQGYYVQGPQGYVISNPQPGFIAPQQPLYQQQGPQMMAQQQFVSPPGYVPYVMTPTAPQQDFLAPGNQPVVSQTPPRVRKLKPSNRPVQNRPPRQILPRPANEEVTANNVPTENPPKTPDKVAKNSLVQQCSPTTGVRQQRRRRNSSLTDASKETVVEKTTSLIVLSDSDDEIEMIITEKVSVGADAGQAKQPSPRKTVGQPKPKPTVTSEVKLASPKCAIPPQIIQRMSQGGISITPIKPAPVQTTNTNTITTTTATTTQLVVVVNETGSHYALALPNGSKLILTPEQVAHIRASNGGKLIL